MNRTKTKRSVFSAMVSMIRPVNSIMVGFAVIVGIAVSSKNYAEIFTLTSAFGFLTGFFISAFSMVSNDVYDFEIDKINQPGRPLPSGLITVREATVFSICLLLLGLLSSAVLGIPNLAIAALFALVGWYYNFRGKKLGLLGNSLVAISLAIPYIFGSIAMHDYALNLGYLLALTSFLAGMGREVLKGISDVPGDRLRGVKTVASNYGTIAAGRVSAIFFLLAIFSSVLPVIMGLLSGTGLFLYSVLIGLTDAVFLFLSYKVLMMKNKESESKKLKGTALAGMMLGLFSYLISSLV